MNELKDQDCDEMRVAYASIAADNHAVNSMLRWCCSTEYMRMGRSLHALGGELTIVGSDVNVYMPIGKLVATYELISSSDLLNCRALVQSFDDEHSKKSTSATSEYYGL